MRHLYVRRVSVFARCVYFGGGGGGGGVVVYLLTAPLGCHLWQPTCADSIVSVSSMFNMSGIDVGLCIESLAVLSCSCAAERSWFGLFLLLTLCDGVCADAMSPIGFGWCRCGGLCYRAVRVFCT